MIRKDMSWYEMLGSQRDQFPDAERESRWNEWRTIVEKAGDDDVLEYWSEAGECVGCKHFNTENAWCKLKGLPASVNPVLTMQHSIKGRACMGLGFEMANLFSD